MRKNILFQALLACCTLPFFFLLCLITPELGKSLPFLALSKLPISSMHIAVAFVPFCLALFLDRENILPLSLALVVSLGFMASVIATHIFLQELYPFGSDRLADQYFLLALGFSTLGLIFGSQAVKPFPGLVIALLILIYTLPPALYFLSLEGGDPYPFMKEISPSWSYAEGNSMPWQFLMLGSLGWSVMITKGIIEKRKKEPKR